MEHEGNWTVRDVEFWRLRLDKGKDIGEPHRGVIDESVEFWDKINSVSRKVLGQLLDFYQPRSILDAGCGIGTLCEWLPAEIHCVGVDFCPHLIQHARTTHSKHPSAWFQVGDLRNLCFLDASFDLVVCRGVEWMVKKGCGEEVWNRMRQEMLRVSRTVVVSMGLYAPHRYDVINQNGSRLICVAEEPPLEVEEA